MVSTAGKRFDRSGMKSDVEAPADKSAVEQYDIVLPVQKRNCTDKLFMILIVSCWIVMTVIGFCSLGIFPSTFILEGQFFAIRCHSMNSVHHSAFI